MALSSWILKTFRGGNPTISLGNLFQCYTPNESFSIVYNLNHLLLLVVLFGISKKNLTVHVVNLINWHSHWGFL